MTAALVVAILGAESTGKTSLAEALAARISKETGRSCTWVPERLREWCDAMGRTPLRHEQAAIARDQHERIVRAAQEHAVVIADTSALMTAVYSRLVFADTSLLPSALQLHQRDVSHSLLTALDLPWQADGLQRDGPHVRAPVDATLREWLITHELPWSLVGGVGPLRLESALDALAPMLRTLARPASGVFTRLSQRNAAAASWRWVCDSCDVPECEHVLRQSASTGQRLDGGSSKT